MSPSSHFGFFLPEEMVKMTAAKSAAEDYFY